MKLLDQNAKLKCHEKTFENFKMQQKCLFYVLLFIFYVSKLEMFFQKQVFISGWNEKIDLVTSNNPNGESHEKIVLKQGEAWLKPGDFT